MSDINAISPLSDSGVGITYFLLSAGYCILIIIFDSIRNKRLAVSKNLLRHLLDGLTFSTGVTVGLAILYPGIFLVVSSNYVYITVTSATCVFGPLINLAERYGFMIET